MKLLTIHTNLRNEEKNKEKLGYLGGFKIQRYTTNIEIFSFEPNIVGAKKIIEKLKSNVVGVSYLEQLIEEVQLDPTLGRKIELLTSPLKNSSKIVKLLEGKTSYTPARFSEVCEKVSGTKKFYYFDEKIRSIFPFHYEPYAIECENEDVKLNLKFFRGIYFSMGKENLRYHIQIFISSFSKNAEDLAKVVGAVEKIKELFN